MQADTEDGEGWSTLVVLDKGGINVPIVYNSLGK